VSGRRCPIFRYAISYVFFRRYLKNLRCSILRLASILDTFLDECCDFVHHSSACLFCTYFLKTGNIQFVSLALSTSKYHVNIAKRATLPVTGNTSLQAADKQTKQAVVHCTDGRREWGGGICGLYVGQGRKGKGQGGLLGCGWQKTDTMVTSAGD
jgi:hypothetical protein